MAKKGDTKIVNNARYTYDGKKWKVTGPPRTMTSEQARNARNRKNQRTPGYNPERGDAYRTGNRKTERQIAAEQEAKSKPKPKPKPTKPAKPTNRGAGNGAPGASSAVTRPQAEKKKVRGGNNKAGRTSRLEAALASVKKYTPKKNKK